MGRTATDTAKLSKMQDTRAKEVRFKSRELIGINGKGSDRTARSRCPVAGCVASACKSGHRGASDPVVRDTAEGLGPEGLPSGIGPAALCRRPTADHALYFCPAPSWAHPYKGRRISGFVQAIFGGFLSISPRSQKTSVFWGVPIVDSIPGITCIIRILGGH